MFGCEEQPDPRLLALNHLQTWFEAAANNQRDETLCHGLGLLKDKHFTCTDYLDEASAIAPASRSVTQVTPLDCHAEICGEFFELEIVGEDKAGNESREIVVLKQDDGQMRVYWYRSSAMLRAAQALADQAEEDAKDPIQAAYDELTNRHPQLYEFVPCLDTRASSSTLLGKTTALAELDPQAFADLANTCNTQACITTVGHKFAMLCVPTGN